MERLLLCLVCTACVNSSKPEAEINSIPPRGPMLGGGLLALHDGIHAVVSDPDRGLIWLLDLDLKRAVNSVSVGDDSLPFRAVEDSQGHVQVLLRGTGELATFSVNRDGIALQHRQRICPEPRGLTWDTTRSELLVACAGGELVTLSPTGIPSSRWVNEDLRDVVVQGSERWVTTFRSASLIALDVAQTHSPPSFTLTAPSGSTVAFVPDVAWRTFASPNGVVMVHQRALDGDPALFRGSIHGTGRYDIGGGKECGSGVVRSAITVFNQGEVTSSFEVGAVLAVDSAISPDGSEVAVASAGNLNIVRVPTSEFGRIQGELCGAVVAPLPENGVDGRPISEMGQVVAVAYRSNGQLLALSRDPLQLRMLGQQNQNEGQIAFDVMRVDSPGHRLFHSVAPAGSACASCHAEGGEDAHVWVINGGIRRTMTLTGGISKTAPFHWKGDLADMDDILRSTFVALLGGHNPSAQEVTTLLQWLDTLASPLPAANAMLVDVRRGAEVFAATCANCHSGNSFTNNVTVNVGTGDSFQVPSLKGVSSRGPWMHNGCAQKLEDRFDIACGGNTHPGFDMSKPDIAAVVAYLKTL